MITTVTKTCGHCYTTFDMESQAPLKECPFCGENLDYDQYELAFYKSTSGDIGDAKNASTLARKPKGQLQSRLLHSSAKQSEGKASILKNPIFVIAGSVLLGVIIILWLSGNFNFDFASSTSNASIIPSIPTRVPDIKAPNSSEYYKGKNYRDALSDFERAGFTDVEAIPMKDKDSFLQFWIGEEEVDTIYVNGDSEYNPAVSVPANVSVMIYYHSKN